MTLNLSTPLKTPGDFNVARAITAAGETRAHLRMACTYLRRAAEQAMKTADAYALAGNLGESHLFRARSQNLDAAADEALRMSEQL